MLNASFILSLLLLYTGSGKVSLPIDAHNRNNIYSISLTEIGEFGIVRKSRPRVPEHLHTGIDIKRPNNNYGSEPIFSITDGVVISKREDGPFGQLIIEHEYRGEIFWTVYEHIAGINVELYQSVNSNNPIARFFNRDELEMYGWQFDHFHFEVLKKRPIEIQQNKQKPQRLFRSYTLECYSKEQLDNHFYNPLEFLEERL